MRLSRFAVLVPTVAAAAVLAVPTAHAATVARTLPSGVAIKVTTQGVDHFIDVTGTAGDNKILLKIIPATGNISAPHIGVTDGVTTFDTKVNTFGTTGKTVITVNGVSGNDTISLAGLNTVPFVRGQLPPLVYKQATLRTGPGNSTLTAANSGTNLLIAGTGTNLLNTCNGRAGDTVRGDGNDTAQADSQDTRTGITTLLSCTPK
ncbi:hypothetical protein [Streptomyces sp. NBC_00233]|uniref:hypothetical protein n=1 Tax=Streptomyces sp. NBC_00233 TaxID=2975686 RepID=UPI0022514884|nr:hypothetical protein [Streptomyces sp. NBC_00233]MCX5233506.1 hypothetical protein [Streptomyces sp. NBC_00233]